MRYTSPDLHTLPAPTIIEALDYETILAMIKDDVIAQAPELHNVLSLESEPITKLCQAFAYRILHERKRVNDCAQSLMLAYAKGSQLDNLGALPFINTARHVIQQANPATIPATKAIIEKDEDYRTRMQMALEGYSTAGSAGAYHYHGLSADADVKDISVDAPHFTIVSHNTDDGTLTLHCKYTAELDTPMPGDVAITVLCRNGYGQAKPELLETVTKVLNKEHIRPLTDRVRVRSASIIPYQVIANLMIKPGPDTSTIIEHAQKNVSDYVNARHILGANIPISGLHAALHVGGVEKVIITQPQDSITTSGHQAPYCTAILLTHSEVK